MTYQQSVFKLYHSDKHFSEFYLQDGVKNQLAYRYGTKLGPTSVRHCVIICIQSFRRPRSGVWTEAFDGHIQLNRERKCAENYNK